MLRLTTGKIIKFLLLSLFSGCSSFLFLTFVNRLSSMLISGEYNTADRTYILLFLLIITIYIWARRLLSLEIIGFSQDLFWSLRKDVIHWVLSSDYKQLVARKTLVHAALVRDVNVLTQASLNIIQFSTSIIIVVACLIYMACISWPLFLVSLGVMLSGILIYQLNAKVNNELFKKGRALEDRFMYYFNAILAGFKEIYMDTRKGESIYQRKIKRVAAESVSNHTSAFVGFLNNQITGQVLFYLLIGSLLLYFGVTLHISNTNVVSFLFILLYLLGAVETIMVLLPNLLQAKVSADRISNLRKELESDKSVKEKFDIEAVYGDFQHIRAADIIYRYENDNGNAFEIGPVNFSIEQGEIIFIYGGNGSGKTTFVSNILGLLKPQGGSLYFNNNKISDSELPSYSAIYSVVFSDFYLFDEFYGIDEVDTEKLAFYLKLFEIDAKVTVEDAKFSTIELSTGQRKRLALITALMENKPILVMDEWAADQDPYFRQKFYLQIIPWLKENGITVLAITHDDKYYHCADKLFKMEYGQLIRKDINHVSEILND